MSTHAILGVKYPDGSIDGCYIHYDGYPEHMTGAIENFLENKTTSGLSILIKRAQGSGGIRSFNSPASEGSSVRVTNFLDDSEKLAITESTWLDDNCGPSFRYLVCYNTESINVEKVYE